ncbi:MAG: DNA-directed RNA polymerase subunit beta [Planctomycetota bacterium]|jgi:DNA-directed RNA polymerase subunit beta
MEVLTFGRSKKFPLPNLVDLQTKSYEDWLQAEVPFSERESRGLQSIISEIFPIESYDGTMSLEFLGYELGAPRYTADECRRLRLTYGAPFKIRVRLNKEEPVEEEVYLGELPIMIGGGEFIINGTERVIVSQLHRSPGVDFSVEIHTSDKKLHSCWIIPERGSWIELNVSKKDALHVRIDQSGKFAATMLVRAISEDFSTDADIIRLFHKTARVKRGTRGFIKKITGRYVVEDVVDQATGEILVPAGDAISDHHAELIQKSNIKDVEIINDLDDPLILNTLAEDNTTSHEDALLRLYSRLRPGNPPQPEKARELFREKFFDVNRYRLGKVGRFRLNRKFSKKTPEDHQILTKDDLVDAVAYILKLRNGVGEVDDIDHLGNRRVRSIAELGGDEIRKGFLKLRRTAQERMNIENRETITPRSIINSKTISSAIDYFFGRGELSQVVDQTNPLSQLTHERRLSALGPGGLNRKRAGFEVRDVHISHYGRICPIETPEGTNIGLIASLGLYSKCDPYGFLVTPYQVVENGRVTDEVRYLRADEELDKICAPADTQLDKNGKIKESQVLIRRNDDFLMVPAKDVNYVDISPMQLVGVSAALIPFLEHDDANRALMGSNMQRQAVPLVKTEAPLVATGMERAVVSNSGMVPRAKENGTVIKSTSREIVVKSAHGEDKYELRKFVGLNERTCLNQSPLVREGDKVEEGQVLADSAATDNGELALGKNILVAFMPFDGYNFEDAVLISEELLREDTYTSIHIEEFEIEIRETKLGREEFTNDIPNVSERALRNLDEDGIVRVGTHTRPGDILVGKVSPKSKSELSPEEKLLHAIFGRAGEDVKNDSLEVPSGVGGIVIDAQKFSRKVNMTEEERQRNLQEIKRLEREFLANYQRILEESIREMEEEREKALKDPETRRAFSVGAVLSATEFKKIRDRLRTQVLKEAKSRTREKRLRFLKDRYHQIDVFEAEKNKLVNRLSRGDELPTGVLEMVKVYLATKRKMSVGDKVAGRHGNKGVISRIVSVEDMPYLPDGTPVQMMLNPLGVPSRMNVGQILETHLGWAAKQLGYQVVTPVFDGCKESDVEDLLERAGLNRDGKSTLHDGRTGDKLEQRVTVGYMYMLKLHHLVDDKVHARATGPYSLITQQPLGGKARFGGQRFGEMEVWALEAYGAAHILQELLTVKSDDVDGRMKIYESMVKGENILEAGTPVSFEVLTNEIKGLALNLELVKQVF